MKSNVLRWLGGLLVLGGAGIGSGCASTRCGELATAPSASTGAATQQHQAKDGVCLQGFRWQPAAEPKGVVVVVHGLRDHAERYGELSGALVAANFAVHAGDMRGHGVSGGARQRFDSIDQLVQDVDQVVQGARVAHPGKPLFLYGHSLGGLVVSHYTLRHQGDLAGVVLSGAALRLQPDVTGGKIAAVRFFGVVFPWWKLQELDDSKFVSTDGARELFRSDPRITHENLPVRSARAAINAIQELEPRFEEFSTPLLILHGGEDKTTSIDGSRELARRARSADKTLRIWEGQAHDLLHEPAAPQIIAEVVSWLEKRSAPAAAP